MDFHDIAIHHDFAYDKLYRLGLIEMGIYNFPLPIKQGSISFAHSVEDIEETIKKTEVVVRDLVGRRSGIVL